MTLHPDIERLAALGWRLHPASQFSRAACIKDAADLATCDRDQLARWSHRFPGCSWRVVMEGSGIWALDVDVPGERHAADGMAALAALVRVHGAIPRRPMTRSGGGGCALFFRHDGEPIHGKSGHPAPGIDPRRGRLTVTVPPSIHPDTRRVYRWIVAPWELAPPRAPTWLLHLLAPPSEPAMPDRPLRLPEAGAGRRRYAMAALHRAVERVAAALEGTRNDTLNREVYAMTRFMAEGSLDASEISVALAYAGRQVGLLPNEIRATLTSALAAGVRR